ncbi:hypothetical protein F1C10_14485 [Sphingomonas sp. NBWT7]|nr:hypothetical protein F1C10_14485 [Sphingomonas sp. NBWT7]
MPASPFVLALRSALHEELGERVTSFEVGNIAVEVRAIGDSLWALARRQRQGGLAIRVAFMAGPFTWRLERAREGEARRISVDSAMGGHRIVFETAHDMLERLRVTVCFTPAVDMLMPFTPRDLYPIDRAGDPLGTAGIVQAQQRGVNAGLIYFRIEEPSFGNVLYFQNLTALNDVFLATGTKPEGVVGGIWPELGYLPPTPPLGEMSSAASLPAGKAVALSDAIMVFRHDPPPDERQSARHFLQMLGAAYRMIDLPQTSYRDWIDRADRTLDDLESAPEATIRHYGHRYVHPYTAAEYPDIMVQMSLISALHDWGKWIGEPTALEAELKRGVPKFYDAKLKTLRRYLPNVGKDKDADAVDSWYLYHPLLNLGNLALGGDGEARDLLLKSLDYAIKVAHHFDYRWPIQFKVTDFSVITETAGADGRGQTDVGGIYAWIMLQAYELTDEPRYIAEAQAAIEAAIGLGFDLNYQANLTAWGAAACMRLWRITNRHVYLDQSYVYLASFFHNSVLWQSRLGHASAYETFMGVTCLQDAPYMAIYECFEAFLAFERYLGDSGPDLEPAARLLVSQYCRYALSRAWFYYPDALPKEAIAAKQRDANGHVDRALSFPLEDLYPDGQEAGQVGQEVYGAGAAFIFATRAFHHVEGAPFRLFCDHFVYACERTGDRALSLTLDGGEACVADFSLVRVKRRAIGKPTLMTAGGDIIRPRHTGRDRIDFHVPASGRLILTWE